MEILQLLIGSLCIAAASTYCQMPGQESERGFCIPLENCTVLNDRARKSPTDLRYRRYLESSHKSCQSWGTNVCCPSLSQGSSPTTTEPRQRVPRRLPTEDENCGIAKPKELKIIGGEDSYIGAWPWMALIGYSRWTPPEFKCGGTLITAKHVITAAHCSLIKPIFVRLGEFDLSTPSETTHVDIDVKKFVRHPNFNTTTINNDIAVILLKNTVQFTDLISPICMPVSKALRSKSYVGYKAFVAGWGRNGKGETSDVLQQLEIPVLKNSVCRTTFNRKRRAMWGGTLPFEEYFGESTLCAGDLAGGRDSCNGDSGGPLMLSETYKGRNHYYLIGIVSYGIGCGKVGLPAKYTSTQYFMDWIHKIILIT